MEASASGRVGARIKIFGGYGSDMEDREERIKNFFRQLRESIDDVTLKNIFIKPELSLEGQPDAVGYFLAEAEELDIATRYRTYKNQTIIQMTLTPEAMKILFALVKEEARSEQNWKSAKSWEPEKNTDESRAPEEESDDNDGEWRSENNGGKGWIPPSFTP
jgi:hypothetical protein